MRPGAGGLSLRNQFFHAHQASCQAVGCRQGNRCIDLNRVSAAAARDGVNHYMTCTHEVRHRGVHVNIGTLAAGDRIGSGPAGDSVCA